MNSLAALAAAVGVAVPAQPGPLEKAWYAPHELLPQLAGRDGLRWAVPETLAGRAWVGGPLSYQAALDEACKQWGLAWTEAPVTSSSAAWKKATPARTSYFDPEHNAFVLFSFRDKQVWAYRHKAVEVGTRAR